MKKLFILIVCLFAISCYDDNQSVDGRYYIKSSTPIRIEYTDAKGEVVNVVTSELNYSFKIEQEDVSNTFYHCIKWESDRLQDVYMLVEFNNGEYTEYDTTFTNKLSYETCLYYCVPWNTECAKVTIHF